MKMNRIFLFLAMLVLGLFSSSWAQFPCYPGDSVGADCCGADSSCYIADDCGYSLDLGTCDTLHVVPRPKPDTCFAGNCINNPGENFPCFVHFNLLVTHDSITFYSPEGPGGPTWIQDSVAAFVLPLAWTRTNSSAYCSLSGYWNENAMNLYDPRFPRSIWRHFHLEELDSNRMASLAAQFAGLEWSTIVLGMTSDSSWYYYKDPFQQDDSLFTPPRMWLTMIRSATNRGWWEGERTLLATFTLKLEDSMTVCIDSTFWPPASRLGFTRYDAKRYLPRSNLPVCFRVHADTVEVLPTGVRWIEGSTEEDSRPTSFSISQNYPNPFNPVTEFKLSLPRASHTKVEVFNILGQKVKTLVDEDMRAGSYAVDWDGKDETGAEVSSGVYFYWVRAGDFSDVRKMVLLR